MQTTLAKKLQHHTPLLVGTAALLFAVAELAVIVQKLLPIAALLYFREPRIPTSCCVRDPADATFLISMWITLDVAGSAIAGAISAWSAKMILRFWITSDQAGRLKRIAIISAKCIGFGFLVYLSSPGRWLNSQGCLSDVFRLKYAGWAFFVGVAFAMVGLWAATMRVKTLPFESIDPDSVRNYVFLRRSAQTLLALASLVLVCGVIHLLLCQRMISVVTGKEGMFGGDFVIEGIRYSLILAAAYTPIHLRFNFAGELLLSHIVGVPASTSGEDVKRWAETKRGIEDTLSLNNFEWRAFGPGIAVLAPAITGLLSKMIEGFVSSAH